MKQHRIERLLEARTLEASPASDDEVASIWAGALREWADSEVPGLSIPGAFTHVYQAGFRAATALLRAAGYRVRGAVGSHHHNTFYAVGALGDDTLEEIADRMQNVRAGRHAALYGEDEELEPQDLETARSHVLRLLERAHHWITTARPQVVGRLAAPPDRTIK